MEPKAPTIKPFRFEDPRQDQIYQKLPRLVGPDPRSSVRLLYRLLVHHSTMLAFVDNFYILGTTSLAVIPLMFLIKKVQLGQRTRGGINGCGGQ